jgi:purine-nucleoside phosphorylase
MENLFDGDWTRPLEVAKQAALVIAKISGVEYHDIALTLGSGWAKAADLIGETIATIDVKEIPGFFESSVVGHLSTIRSIRLHSGKHALVLGARTHLYENKGVEKVVHGVRTAAACGAKTMVLTNGAGGIPTDWKPGSPILISDHINLTGTTPLVGANFIDMSTAYSQRLRDLAKSVDPTLNEGIYVQFRGPQYETPAEVQMAARIGGDLVGMSTALETIAAREAGLEVLGLSLMTNQAAGIQKTPLSHEEVLAAGKAAESRISKLLADIIGKL